MSLDVPGWPVAAAIAKWTGRALAALLFVFWGLFFIEHLAEWFLHWGGPYPPPHVWLAQLSHFAIVAGFVLMLRWRWTGSIAVAAGTLGFIFSAGFYRPPLFFLLNLAPVVCFCLEWLAELPRKASQT